MSTQTQQLTQSPSANTAERGDPKLKKKFLLTKPTYRPNHIGVKGGIACHQPPRVPPPSSMPPPSSLTTTGPDPPPPPVQCCIGAKIALPAASHRHESGAIIYFDCRCTTAAACTASSIPPPSLALAPAPRQHPRPSSRRPTSPPQLFFVFLCPKREKSR